MWYVGGGSCAFSYGSEIHVIAGMIVVVILSKNILYNSDKDYASVSLWEDIVCPRN